MRLPGGKWYRDGSALVRLVIFLLIGYFLFCAIVLAAEKDYVKPRLAVAAFDTKNVDAATVQAVTELVQSRFENSNLYLMVERAQVDRVFREQAFQYSGSVDEATAIRIGKMLGASKLVLGSINKIGDAYTISARIVDVETGMIEMSDTEACRSAVDLKDSIDLLAKNIIARDRSRFQSFLSIATPEKGLTGFYAGMYGSLLHFPSGSMTIYENLNANINGTSMSPINPCVGFRYYALDKVFLDFGYIPSSAKTVGFSLSDGGVINEFKLDVISGASYTGSVNYTFYHSKRFRFSSGVGTAYSTIDMNFKGAGPGFCYYYVTDPTYYLNTGQEANVQYLLYFANAGVEWLLQKKMSIGIAGNYFYGGAPAMSLAFNQGDDDGEQTSVRVFKPEVDRFNLRLLVSFYF